ncbi:MAG: 7-carboxy-7-deazaguanine synthase QueE [Clostridia bacterium]|nr:7-carboxy-7-deazaguanine synthase QueE [Clostridia bacterium]
MEAQVVEIMSSIQGEGLMVGYRQIFVRFAGCNLRCDYCDTPKGLEDAGPCQVEETPGRRDFSYYPNPLSLTGLRDIIHCLQPEKHHSISFTGGEPLLRAKFLQELIPLLDKGQAKVYLETNGTLPEELGQILDLIDIISMDFKLPSVTCLPGYWEQHREFLKIAVNKEVYVKVVFGAETQDEEIMMVIDTISSVDSGIPLVLQPVTPREEGKGWPPPVRVIALQDLCGRYLTDVRVIPQTHKLLGQL